MKTIYIFFLLAIFTVNTHAESPVYNFTFHNYVNSKSDDKKSDPASSASAVANILQTSPTKAPKEEKLNKWKFFSGVQEQNFDTRGQINTHSEGINSKGLYSKGKFKIRYLQVGFSAPLAEKWSLKPMLLIGQHGLKAKRRDSIYDMDRDPYEPVDYVTKNSNSVGNSIGFGTDLEYAFNKYRFDIPVGLSYRYFKNERGIFRSFKKVDSWQSEESQYSQSIHTLAFYVAPTFRYKSMTLSSNVGYGHLIDERITNASDNPYNGKSKKVLDPNFVQYGINLAFNI